MNELSSQIIINILAQEMNLPPSNIWLRNQNKKIPPDDGLYVVVGIVDSHPYSNVTKMLPVTIDGQQQMQQCQSVTLQENIQVDIFSRSLIAAQRSWEVIAAIHSLYAQQAQEINSFKIFRNALQLIDTSGVEGGSQINRYTLRVVAFRQYHKTKVLPQNTGTYYDDFTQQVDDDVTGGIINFEINSTGVH